MVITVSNQKGGVGKTTTSAALAAGFSMACPHETASRTEPEAGNPVSGKYGVQFPDGAASISGRRRRGRHSYHTEIGGGSSGYGVFRCGSADGDRLRTKGGRIRRHGDPDRCRQEYRDLKRIKGKYKKDVFSKGEGL